MIPTATSEREMYVDRASSALCVVLIVLATAAVAHWLGVVALVWVAGFFLLRAAAFFALGVRAARREP